jgi:hypothetical protein
MEDLAVQAVALCEDEGARTSSWDSERRSTSTRMEEAEEPGLDRPELAQEKGQSRLSGL